MNGCGLVLANHSAAPLQAYSCAVLPNLSVLSFADIPGIDYRPQTPQWPCLFRRCARSRPAADLARGAGKTGVKVEPSRQREIEMRFDCGENGFVRDEQAESARLDCPGSGFSYEKEILTGQGDLDPQRFTGRKPHPYEPLE